jgi:hypothetical protein
LRADVGVEGPEVEVGVLSVHSVSAPRGGAQSPAWSVAADRDGADEAAEQKGHGRPGHSAVLPSASALAPRAAFSTLLVVRHVQRKARNLEAIIHNTLKHHTR